MQIEDIPLPDNTATGYSCGEVAVIAAIAYLGAQPSLDEEKARSLTHKVPRYNTWPEQLIRIARTYPGIHATIHRSTLFTIPAKDFIRSQYSVSSAGRLLVETDLPDLESAIRDVRNSNDYAVEPVNVASILAALKPGCVVIAWVDFDALYDHDTSRGFNAHYVIVTGYDETTVYVHECGGTNHPPEANKPVSRERFERALGPDRNFMIWERKNFPI